MKRHELFRKNLWLAIGRAPTDKRALSFLGRITYLVAYCAYLIVMFLRLGIWGAVTWGVILALAGGVAVLISRNNNRSDDSLLKLSARPIETIPNLLAHRQQISNVLLRSAILVDRAGSEISRLSGKLKEEHHGLARQRTLRLAREPQIWDGFSAEERDLLLSAEGSWSWDATWPRVLLAEDVNIYRWVVGIDPILTPLEFITLDMRPAIGLTITPEQLMGASCKPSWDLRLPLASTDQMLVRCLAEGIQRGVYTEPEESSRLQYLEIAEQFGGKSSEDLLIGGQTVAKAHSDKIQMMGQVALRRKRVLEALIEYLSDDCDAVSQLDTLRFPDKETANS